MRACTAILSGLVYLCSPARVCAHASEQGFVLLLPTEIYITSGILTVVLTVIALIVLPATFTHRLFTPIKLLPVNSIKTLRKAAGKAMQLFVLLALTALIVIGFTGTHDPLRNLLPLFVWTVFWMGLVSVTGLFGNLWAAVNPLQLFADPWAGRFTLPTQVGSWPGVTALLLFSVFSLADIAPEDPNRLARVVTAYLCYTIFACYLFGTRVWLIQGECFTMIMSRMSRVSAPGTSSGRFAVGMPGWKILSDSSLVTLSGAVFTLTLLATSSFDGLNETFWWLQQLGINPLEFPGRSAVVWQTVTGLMLSTIALVICFASCVCAGTRLANRFAKRDVRFSSAFRQLSVAIIPIALAYHIAHYLTSFMVNIQYTVAALSDPLQNGRDLLGLGTFYVTTGFFNTQSSVRTIWLSQAGTVVAGHVVSLLVSHRIAFRLWRRSTPALLSQFPLAVFMVFYTLLGLWLLAAPRGA